MKKLGIVITDGVGFRNFKKYNVYQILLTLKSWEKHLFLSFRQRRNHIIFLKIINEEHYV